MRTSKPDVPHLLLIAALLTGTLFVLALMFEWPELRMLSKPLPVLCLCLWTLLSGLQGSARLVSIALAFGLTGDILLEIQYQYGGERQTWFALGLGSFLLGHLCYLGYFLALERRPLLISYLPFLAWGLLVFVLSLPALGGLTIPVAVYILVATAVMWRALTLTDSQSRHVSIAQCAGWGALLFGLSDSMIAINRFVVEFPGARYAIILTYWIGQYGIARYAIFRAQEPPMNGARP